MPIFISGTDMADVLNMIFLVLVSLYPLLSGFILSLTSLIGRSALACLLALLPAIPG